MWVCDYFVFDSYRGGWIEEFDGDDFFSMFHWKIDERNVTGLGGTFVTLADIIFNFFGSI